MTFDSPLFLFAFLPGTLLLSCLTPRPLRKYFLLLASLVFYVLSDARHLSALFASTLMNYAVGRLLAATSGTRSRKALLAAGLAGNLALLCFYKYLPFAASNLARLGLFDLSGQAFANWVQPLGVSFFTFGAMAYLIDVYRKTEPATRDLAAFALFMAFFPKITAGPIARHAQMDGATFTPSLENAAEGVKRICVGLAKKTLIAIPTAMMADLVFSFSRGSLGMCDAWLGTICYTLQIYYDFSGYTDIAVGLGLLFGVRLPENFNYPYLSQSIQEFWRRWHITLSLWFRDYLYFPLGGNRKGLARTLFNLCLVFTLCGLWHGASWTFLAWGLFHGLFLVLERLFLARLLSLCPRALRHAYAMLAVTVGWVFFRAADLGQALDVVATLFAGRLTPLNQVLVNRLDNQLLLALVAGLVCCGPFARIFEGLGARYGRGPVGALAALCLLLLSLGQVAAGTYSSFIYAGF